MLTVEIAMNVVGVRCQVDNILCLAELHPHMNNQPLPRSRYLIRFDVGKSEKSDNFMLLLGLDFAPREARVLERQVCSWEV